MKKLVEEDIRWATEVGFYKGIRYLPNIMWNDNNSLQKVTKREGRSSTLACNSFFVVTFGSRVQARLFERSWHLMLVAHLSIVYGDHTNVEVASVTKEAGFKAYGKEDIDRVMGTL